METRLMKQIVVLLVCRFFSVFLPNKQTNKKTQNMAQRQGLADTSLHCLLHADSLRSVLLSD